MLELVVDNTKILRDATFDRETRLHLEDASNGLRTLAAIVETARDIERPESSMSYTALGYAVAKHLSEMDPWDVREFALAVDEVGRRWDANDKTQIRLLPDGGFEDASA